MLVGQYETGPTNDGNSGIFHANSMQACEEIPDNSIAMILCDPVYWEIEQYAWLSTLAARVLVNGGNVVAQTGTEYRYAAEKAMVDAGVPLGMALRPLLIETYSGGGRMMFPHRAIDRFHPYIWMTKGGGVREYGGRWVHTLVRGAPDKSYHEWGDGAAAYISWILAMSMAGDVVLDPFTGGGVVPAVCKTLGRRWLAFEIDEEKAAAARQRIARTQPPLFVDEGVASQADFLDTLAEEDNTSQ